MSQERPGYGGSISVLVQLSIQVNLLIWRGPITSLERLRSDLTVAGLVTLATTPPVAGIMMEPLTLGEQRPSFRWSVVRSCWRLN